MKNYNANYNVDIELLSAAVFFSEDSIIITDTELEEPGPRIVYVNPGFTRMTGYTPEEVLGKNPRILQGPKTDRSVLVRLKQTLERGEVFYGQAINYKKDGSEFYNEWHIEPIQNANGEKTHYLAIQHDVTERVKTQQAIEQKNIALREILEQIELEKQKMKENVVMNIEQVVMPAFEKLKRKGTRFDRKYIDIIEHNLKDLTSSFGIAASQQKLKLSPREIEIANLIKHGLSSKEICQSLNISFKTIETHRNKIRKKLGIVNQDVNLTTYLQNL
ncbi:MAG: PAS domain S-box protein [Candidatus Omnitrophica bacterium]|nr:PAS domain S-box protein [Candidatus Omnitrophota bacterium]